MRHTVRRAVLPNDLAFRMMPQGVVKTDPGIDGNGVREDAGLTLSA